MSRGKTLILFILLAVFAVLLVLFVWTDASFQIQCSLLKANRTQDETLAQQAFSTRCVYSDADGVFYYPVAASAQGRAGSFPLTFDGVQVLCDAQILGEGRLRTENFKDTVSLLLYDDTRYLETSVVFTTMPQVLLQCEGGVDALNAGSEAEILVISAYNPADEIVTQPVQSRCEVHMRGQTALAFPEKSYTVKLVDENGEKRNEELFGMRNDNRWILDAAYSDTSKLRNLLASDIWNLMTQDADYPHAVMETRLCEVTINGEYHGIYVMKTPVDRKALNLQQATEDSSGLLGRFFDLGFYQLQGWSGPEISFDTGIEIKYPDETDPLMGYYHAILGEQVGAITRALDQQDEQAYRRNLVFDSVVDYWLCENVIGGSDNVYKNFYFAMPTSEGQPAMSLAIWDMDLTFGLEYDDDSPLKASLRDNTQTLFGHQFISQAMISQDAFGFFSAAKARWAELREDGLDADLLVAYLRQQADLLESSGARQRHETLVYPQGDAQQMWQQMEDYIPARFTYLDDVFDYEEGAA